MAPMELVVLLHGMGRSRGSMWWAARSLRRRGYQVVNRGYASFARRIEELAVDLRGDLVLLAEREGVSRIHIVTHSLGGIVARAALAAGPVRKVGRIVMLAPPNRGSTIARLLRWSPWPWPRPLAQLGDHPDSFVRAIPRIDGVEVGVIAGAFDGKVDVEQTHLDGESDHVVVPAVHSFLPMRSDVLRQTAAFLRDGRFERG